MIEFLDASALVKRYLSEAGSSTIAALFRRKARIAVAGVTAVEVAAALQRRARAGDLTAADARRHAQQLRVDQETMLVIEVRGVVLELAAGLVAAHPLRAYDAIQLASALRLRRTSGVALRFACADTQLNRAAKAEGLRVLALP